MPDQERKAKLEAFKAAMERVSTGSSAVEEVDLPSGDRVILRRDETSPNGIRVETVEVPGERGFSPLDEPGRRAMMEGIRAATERIKSGASMEEELVLPDGETIRLSRDEAAPEGFSIESTKGGRSFRARAYGPLPERPSGYPADLPFIAGCPVSISVVVKADGSEEARNAAWMKPPDPESTLDAIREQLRATGWVEGEASHSSSHLGHTRTLLFSRDGAERAVALMSFGEMSQIMLFEKAKETGGH